MNIFENALPDGYEFRGRVYPCQTDFREWIKFELLMLDDDIAPQDKGGQLLRIIFPDVPPDPELWQFILWFYSCGQQPRTAKTSGNGKKTAVYSYEYDDGYIFAAFMEQYGIDLSAVHMHWWQFKALFRALHDCMFTKIMGYRAEVIDNKTPAYRKSQLKELKQLYALPRSLSEQQKIDEAKRVMEMFKSGKM